MSASLLSDTGRPSVLSEGDADGEAPLPTPETILSFLQEIRTGTTRRLHELLVKTDTHYATTLQRLAYMAKPENNGSMGEAKYAMHLISGFHRRHHSEVTVKPSRSGSERSPKKRIRELLSFAGNW